MRFQRAYLIGLALHFILLITVAFRDLFAVLADGSSYLPAALEPRWRVLEDATFSFLAKLRLMTLRAKTALVIACAGSSWLRLLAPSVPYSYKLVFKQPIPTARLSMNFPASEP
jgi:hypothetical protein